MLGELYATTQPGLDHLQNAVVKSMKLVGTDSTIHVTTTRPIDYQIPESFLEQTQMYLLHTANFLQHDKLLDSHHLFTEAFRPNPLFSLTSFCWTT